MLKRKYFGGVVSKDLKPNKHCTETGEEGHYSHKPPGKVAWVKLGGQSEGGRESRSRRRNEKEVRSRARGMESKLPEKIDHPIEVYQRLLKLSSQSSQIT